MEKEKLKLFLGKVFADMASSMAAGMVYIGVESGLFRAMQSKGAMTREQVVTDSGLQERYVHEWLNGMASAGYLEYDADAETFSLPDEHAYLLASDGSDHFAGGLFHMTPALLGVAPKVADCFKNGGGVPFNEYGDVGVKALNLVNQGNYQHKLTSYWLKCMPDVIEALENGGGALDVGCGVGWVSIAMAKAFPDANFTAIDLDEKSVEQASQNAIQEGVTNNTIFKATALDSLPKNSGYDLVTLCDSLHDLARPVELLQDVKTRLNDNGTLFIIEPKAGDRLEDNMNDVGTMFYGFSIFHCMTQSLSQGGPGLGTCMGPAKAESLVKEAGYSSFTVLPIKSNVNLFYRAQA